MGEFSRQENGDIAFHRGPNLANYTCAYGGGFLHMHSAINCFGATFSAPAKINFDRPTSITYLHACIRNHAIEGLRAREERKIHNPTYISY